MDSYDDATIYKIEHAGRVSLPVSRTVAGFFCALAILAAVGRIAVRLMIRRRLFADDYLLLFGLASLGAATGVFYKFSWLIYVLNILKYDRSVIPTASDLKAIMNAQAINYSLMALMWSAIFPVKLCFLVSFKVLIKDVSRAIVAWYWATLSLTIAVWALMIALPFIECPYTGQDLILHCTPETPYKKTIAGNWLAFSTDAITDIMIVAIPVYILRHVRIRLTQKLAIASFLCLSAVMVVTSLIRAVLSRHRGWGDLTMQYLLIYIEACVAISMASIAAYRAVFVERNKQKEMEAQRALDQQQVHHIDGRNFQLQEIPANTFKGRIRQLRQMHNGSDISDGTHISGTAYLDQPRTGGPKLSTVLSFIRGVGRTRQESSVDSAPDLDTFHSGPASKEEQGSKSEGSRSLSYS